MAAGHQGCEHQAAIGPALPESCARGSLRSRPPRRTSCADPPAAARQEGERGHPHPPFAKRREGRRRAAAAGWVRPCDCNAPASLRSRPPRQGCRDADPPAAARQEGEGRRPHPPFAKRREGRRREAAAGWVRRAPVFDVTRFPAPPICATADRNPAARQPSAAHAQRPSRRSHCPTACRPAGLVAAAARRAQPQRRSRA